MNVVNVSIAAELYCSRSHYRLDVMGMAYRWLLTRCPLLLLGHGVGVARRRTQRRCSRRCDAGGRRRCRGRYHDLCPSERCRRKSSCAGARTTTAARCRRLPELQ